MDSLEVIAIAASKATRGHAFTAMVHDSDIADLRLFHAGIRRDRFDSDPSYYGSRKPSTEHFEDPTRDAIVLRLRTCVRPGYETASDEPVTFTAQSFPGDEVRYAVGDEVRVSFAVRSTGKASRGLGVRVWGDAFAQGLVEIERFEVLVGSPREGARHVMVPAQSGRDASGVPMRVADLPDTEIPPGSASEFGMEPGVDMHRMLDAMFRTQVHVNVVGRAIAAGRGELGLGLTPLARNEGADGTHVQLSIDPTFGALSTRQEQAIPRNERSGAGHATWPRRRPAKRGQARCRFRHPLRPRSEPESMLRAGGGGCLRHVRGAWNRRRRRAP